VANYLQLAAGTPLIKFDETGYNEDNEPILKAYSYFRDDLLRLRLLRRRV
jgi:DNA-binding GntR family transcriptional regulator